MQARNNSAETVGRLYVAGGIHLGWANSCRNAIVGEVTKKEKTMDHHMRDTIDERTCHSFLLVGVGVAARVDLVVAVAAGVDPAAVAAGGVVSVPVGGVFASAAVVAFLDAVFVDVGRRGKRCRCIRLG